MVREILQRSAFSGTKRFTQHDVPTANATGFGAAADDYMERGIDLNEELVRNKPATYFFRMNSEAMIEAGIQQRDILVVDRSIRATNGKIIVAAVDGDLVVRSLQQTFNHVTLVAANNRYGNIELGEFCEYRAWGVVTCVIHAFEAGYLGGSRKESFKQATK